MSHKNLYLEPPGELDSLDEATLTGCGYRWCKKDKRWETRRSLRTINHAVDIQKMIRLQELIEEGARDG